MRRLAAAAILAAAAAASAAALDLGLDLGAGAKIDVAPYGIENVTVLATAAPWIGPSDGLQAGALLAGSIGPAKMDLELSVCLRFSPIRAVALFGGGGLVVSRGDGPALVPLLLGGLRLGCGRLGLLACVEAHVKPDDTDKMVWFAALWRLGSRAL
jgi:hypothetical protein